MKGISTLIAAVLLIAVTLLISLIVSTSFTSLVKTQASTIQTRTGEAVNCTSSDINIEDVFVDVASNRGRVTIRNSGQIRENIVRGTMLNDTGSLATSLDTFPISIAKGALTTLTFDTTTNLTCVNFNRVIVTTECTIATFDRNPKNC